MYSSDDFAGAVSFFEKAVEEYFPSNEECRALCEGSYDYDGYNYMEYKADLFQAMTGKFIGIPLNGTFIVNEQFLLIQVNLECYNHLALLGVKTFFFCYLLCVAYLYLTLCILHLVVILFLHR